MSRITVDDVQCLVAAIRLLEDEGFNKETINPKKNLARKLYLMAPEEERVKRNFPKWIKP